MIHLETLDYYIDHNSYEEPVRCIKSTINFKAILDSYKIVFYNLKNLIYRNDHGFVFNNYINKTYISVSSIEETSGWDFEKYRDTEISQVVFSINPRGLHELYKRKYYKIQSIIAECGGFIKIILTSIEIITYLFTRINYNNLLFKEFKDEDINEKESKLNERIKANHTKSFIKSNLMMININEINRITNYPKISSENPMNRNETKETK